MYSRLIIVAVQPLCLQTARTSSAAVGWGRRCCCFAAVCCALGSSQTAAPLAVYLQGSVALRRLSSTMGHAARGGSSNASGSGSAAPQVDEGEVMALILHWLASGPCSDAAAALATEAQAKGLLPQRLDVRGGRHTQSYRQLLSALPRLPGDALTQLLQQAVAAKRQSGVPGALVSFWPAAGWGWCCFPPLPYDLPLALGYPIS